MKLGKTPARPGAVKLKLRRYVSLSRLPSPPAEFGHENLVPSWGMLGNDQYGDCVWAGAAHETMLWNKSAGAGVLFTDESVLSDYSAVTGFNPADPSTDQGTDMQAAAKYRQTTGLVDASGKRHKIGAYLAIEPGDVQHMLAAAYVFQAIAVGVEVPASAMDQFGAVMPWHIEGELTIEGGHYVPLVARMDGMFWCVTWNKLQPMDDDWLHRFNDETLVYLSEEMLAGGKTIDGFDLEALQADLATLR